MKQRSRQCGLTLVEVMVSATILAIAIGGILIGINFGAKAARHNINKTMALNLIVQRLEQIKADSYANVVAVNYPAEAGIAVGVHPIRFNRSVTIVEDAGYPKNRFKTVTVTVTWAEFGAPFSETESANVIISQT